MKLKYVIALFLFLVLVEKADGQSGIVPIAELKMAGLMGGVQNGRWLTPAKVVAGMKPETEFVLVGLDGVEEGGVTLGKKETPGEPCDDFFPIKFELEQDHGVAIASSAKWNPVPRLPKAIDLNNATYKTVVANFLRRKGIARPKVSIKEAFRVDLEGDGVEEVVLSATYYKTPNFPDAAIGDYSFVLLRKAVGKVVTDHMLGGEFYLKKVQFSAPNQYHISAIADLNGDGKMEIVLNGFYYEGIFASAFEMIRGRPVRIKEFEVGCGV